MSPATGQRGGVEILAVSVTELSEPLAGLRLCDASVQRELERSLTHRGQLSPVAVYRSGSGLGLIDGYKRLRAARALGWQELRAEVHAVDEVGAKLLLWQSNVRGGLSDLEQAWLVRALYREEGLSQPEIGRLLGRHKSWVSRRVMLAEGLDEAVSGWVRLGLVSATAARELARLPRGNQAAVGQVVSQRGLTSRQVAQLVERLLGAPDEASYQRELEQVGQSPAPSSVPRRSAAGRTPGEWLVADAASVTRLCARLSARLLERSLGSLGDGAASEAARSLRAALGALQGLTRTITSRLEAWELYGEEHEELGESAGAGAPGSATRAPGNESACDRPDPAGQP